MYKSEKSQKDGMPDSVGTTKERNIAIVGAGIMGRLLAFHFVNAGFDVTLFDQNPSDNQLSIFQQKQPIQQNITAFNNENVSCSMVAVGLLTPVCELEKTDEIIFQLGQAALQQHWPHIFSQLPTPIYFRQAGSLILAHPRDAVELTHFMNRILRRSIPCRETLRYNDKMTSYLNGVNDQAIVYQKLSHLDIQQLEPEITKFQQGYYFPEEGHLDTLMVFHQLGNYLQKKGVKWHSATFVEKVEPFNVWINEKAQKFDMVFDCRGVGAKSLFQDLRGVRGEVIWLHAPDVHISRPVRFLHPRYSIYIVPRPNHIYLIGATEIESEDLGPVTVKTSLELLTAAYAIHPSFAEARVIQSMAQCRPTLADHLPRIKVAEGLVAINGLYRHGYLIGPTIAHDILQWLIKKDLTAVSYPRLWQ